MIDLDTFLLNIELLMRVEILWTVLFDPIDIISIRNVSRVILAVLNHVAGDSLHCPRSIAEK